MSAIRKQELAQFEPSEEDGHPLWKLALILQWRYPFISAAAVWITTLQIFRPSSL